MFLDGAEAILSKWQSSGGAGKNKSKKNKAKESMQLGSAGITPSAVSSSTNSIVNGDIGRFAILNNYFIDVKDNITNG